MKLNTIFLILCTLFWVAAAVLGIVWPEHDWRISFIITSSALAYLMGITAVQETIRIKKEKRNE